MNRLARAWEELSSGLKESGRELALTADPTLIERYSRDPVGFVTERLGVTLWPKQAAILEAIRDHDDVAVKSGHGVGKTFTAACASLWWLYCHSPSLLISTAPTERQVKRLLWKEIGLRHTLSRPRLPGELLKMSLEASPLQSALGFTASEPESAAGQHSPNTLLVIDEASGIGHELEETLKGALTSEHCHSLRIGNPTQPSGPFFDAFSSPLVDQHTISCYDCPNVEAARVGKPLPFPGLVTLEWIEKRKADWGEESSAFRVRVLGEFPLEGADLLVSLHQVMAAEARGLQPGHERSPKVLGLDVARYGDCETVAAIRQGDNLLSITSWSGIDTMKTAEKVAAIALASCVQTLVVDVVGLGAGVFDRLSQLKREGKLTATVVPFSSGARPKDTSRFKSARDEAFWGLRERYSEERIHHAQGFPAYVGQLSPIRYSLTPGGLIQVETKEEMRKSGRKSPDHADAVCMAFAVVGSRPIGGAQGSRRSR